MSLKHMLVTIASFGLVGSISGPASATTRPMPLQTNAVRSALTLAAQTDASGEPQRTSATYGDWIVRCDRTAGTPPKKTCEAVQTFTIKGKDAPFAQLVFAHVPGPTESQLTMLLILPVNLALDKQPTLSVGSSGPRSFQLLRCLPEGCVATLTPGPDLMKDLRGTKTGAATFFDAAGQKVNLPLSPKGFVQALDDLNKESSAK